MRNPATGRQCYGGMKPIDQLDNHQVFEPHQPAAVDVPQQLSRRRALGLPKDEIVEESVE